MCADVEDVRVSVIVPVYNVELYIGCCIESLRAQRLQGLEFIFIDDCSTDNSMAAVDAWASQDARVRILRNAENIGAGPSRNCGIEVARGEYLSFIDSDDYVSSNFYELLYAAATKDGGHDIAKGLRCKVDQDGKKSCSYSERFNKRIFARQSTGKSLYGIFNTEHQTALYRSSLFADDSVRYGATRNAEDVTFLLRCCYQTEDIVFEESAQYYYVWRADSSVHGTGPERTYAELDALSEMIDFIEAKGYDKESRQRLIINAHARLNRFQELLGKGRAERSDYPSVAKRFRELMNRIPMTEDALTAKPQLKEIVSGCPFTTSGKRFSEESDIRVSVVLRIYNPGSRIRNCIESLRAQLLSGLEFIFVDDCSTDDSMVAVKSWAEQDARVHIVRNEQSLGVGLARNRGIEVAQGDYLSFVDPNDWVAYDFYELLYAAAIADGGHDVAVGLRIDVDEDDRNNFKPGAKITNAIEHFSISAETLCLRLFDGFQSAIYKRSIFKDENVRHGVAHIEEDQVFALRICQCTADISVNSSARYYCYTEQPKLTAHKCSLQRLEHELNGLTIASKFFEDEGDSVQARRFLEPCLHRCITDFYLVQANDLLDINAIDRNRETFKSILEREFTHHLLQDDIQYKAFIERETVLPSIDFLATEDKLAGALYWIDCLKEMDVPSTSLIKGCSQAIATAFSQILEGFGVSAFKDLYSQTIIRTNTLPLKLRTILWLETYRCLVTARNTQVIIGKLKHKMLRKPSVSIVSNVGV